MSLRGQLGFSKVADRYYLGDKKPELSLKTESPGGQGAGERREDGDKGQNCASDIGQLRGNDVGIESRE